MYNFYGKFVNVGVFVTSKAIGCILPIAKSTRNKKLYLFRLGVIVIRNSNSKDYRKQCDSNSKDYRKQCNSNSNIIEIFG